MSKILEVYTTQYFKSNNEQTKATLFELIKLQLQRGGKL